MSAPDTRLDVRLVPMSREQRDAAIAGCHAFKFSGQTERLASMRSLYDAWDAAPANSALQARIDACFADAASTRNDVRLAVLAALGCVTARETNEKPA